MDADVCVPLIMEAAQIDDLDKDSTDSDFDIHCCGAGGFHP